jgi:hypothetical protein
MVLNKLELVKTHQQVPVATVPDPKSLCEEHILFTLSF